MSLFIPASNDICYSVMSYIVEYNMTLKKDIVLNTVLVDVYTEQAV